MRVALCADGRSPHTQRWANAVADRGHEVAVVWESPDLPGADLTRYRDSISHHTHVRPTPQRRPLMLPLAPVTAHRLARAVRPVVVHGLYLSGYGWTAHALRTRPLVLSALGSDVLDLDRRTALSFPPGAATAYGVWRTRRAVAAADVVFADSAAIADAVVGHVPDTNTRIVRFGVELTRATATTRAEWRQRLRVTISDMRSANFIGAGDTTFVFDSPRKPVSATAGTFVSAGSPLEHGNAYAAVSYYPRPGGGQLRRAPTVYAPGSAVDLTLKVADKSGQMVWQVLFPSWGQGGQPLSVDTTSGLLEGGGLEMLRSSAYGPMYALAQRLRRGATTPYDYARAVMRYMQIGFAYDEDPPQRAVPLEDFLFRDKRGYCQQFSGAMALLLRMGGVPARVAAGFAPGSLDSDQGDYVVRDTDAHSWVEAYFPSIGWVTFDPTPTAAPARRPFNAAATAFPVQSQGGGSSARGSAVNRADVVAHGQATPLWRRAWFLVLVGLALAAGAVLAVVLWVERRRHPPGAPELAELERALRRARRSPSPRTTLRDLERSLGPDEGVLGYLSAVRSARYGTGAVTTPTGAQRRALRRVLGDGLGLRGRVRALWALPPRLDTWPVSSRRTRA